MNEPSTRAQVITRRTYSRPLDDEGTIFETWEMTVDRVIEHQRFLWERAKTSKVLEEMPLHDLTPDMSEWQKLTVDEEFELTELKELIAKIDFGDDIEDTVIVAKKLNKDDYFKTPDDVIKFIDGGISAEELAKIKDMVDTALQEYEEQWNDKGQNTKEE